RSDRRDAARVLFHALARYRYLDSDFIFTPDAKAFLLARCPLRRAAETGRDAATGRGIDGGVEPGYKYNGESQSQALSSRDAVAGRVDWQGASVADRAALRIVGSPADCLRQSG